MIVHTQIVKNEQFDGLISKFTEIDGIERAIARMKEIDKPDFIIPKQNPYVFDI